MSKLLQYLHHAYRTLSKYRFYTIINIVGLVCGMLPALIIAKYLAGSLQMDLFHENRDRIYSVSHDEFIDGNHQTSNSTYPGVEQITALYPETGRVTRFADHVNAAVTVDHPGGEQVSFIEKNIFIADSNFLKVFSFRLMAGDAAVALSRPNSVVLTSAASRKYFNNEDPIGKSLTTTVSWGERKTYTVTGVLADLPKQSQFNFDFLVTDYKIVREELWKIPDRSLFLLLPHSADPVVLQAKLNAALSNVPDLRSEGKKVTLTLNKFGEVQWSNTEYLLAALGLFILLTCWTNYINQIIAQTYGRVKEIGILRINGATRRDLQSQFIVESGITCLISFVIIVSGYSLVESILPHFGSGRTVGLTEFREINLVFIAVFLAGIAVTAIIPTAILFSQDFGASLRNAYSAKVGGVRVRKALVVFQVTVCCVLFISIFVISGQLDYVLRKEKGFNTNDVLVVEAPLIMDSTWVGKRKALRLFKERCMELPFVVEVASSTTVPGEEYRQETYLSRDGSDSKSMIHQCQVDAHFFSVYEMDFVAGRDFIPHAMAQNSVSIVLNESAARALGIQDFEAAIGTRIVDHDQPEQEMNLIGVVRDFHQTSLHYKMAPMAFKYQLLRGHLSIKINPASLNQHALDKGIAAIKERFSESYPHAPFIAYFLNETFATEYAEEQYYRTLFGYFTVISIVVSCLGLFGLSSLMSARRRKEIGIRKTFGASPVRILVSFVTDYGGQLLIAMAIGCPVAYILMEMWLMGYAYRIEIGFVIVSKAAASLALVFLVAVTYHTVKSSLTNPVNVLRD